MKLISVLPGCFFPGALELQHLHVCPAQRPRIWVPRASMLCPWDHEI